MYDGRQRRGQRERGREPRCVKKGAGQCWGDGRKGRTGEGKGEEGMGRKLMGGEVKER